MMVVVAASAIPEPNGRRGTCVLRVAAHGVALLASAYLMTLARASADYGWLAWGTLLPLFFSIRVLSPRRAMAAGVFWGLGLFVFSAFSQNGFVEATARSLALLTLIPGVYSLVLAAITRRVGFSPLLLGLGWVGVELALRPLALHHGLLAGTQGDGLFIHTLGQLAGFVLVAFVVAYVNASMLSMLRDVCVTGEPTRFAARSTSRYAWRHPTESTSFLIHIPLLTRPRAPPA